MHNFIIRDGKVFSDTTQHALKKGLPSSVYTATFDGNSETTSLVEFDVHSDKIVDIPDSTFSNLVAEVNLFFKEETKAKFDKLQAEWSKQ